MKRKGHKLIIAVDGPAGAGKSTVARVMAKKIGITYIDTGAMYRAATWKVLTEKIKTDDVPAILKMLASVDFSFKNGRIYLNKEDVTDKLRLDIVDKNVSQVAAIGQVRCILIDQQRKLGARESVVMDGRDIGTCVFPRAQLKIFLSASPVIRAKRRYLEIIKQGQKKTFAETLAGISRRDFIDSTRSTGPLRPALDAVYIDTSHMTIKEVVEEVLVRVREANLNG